MDWTKGITPPPTRLYKYRPLLRDGDWERLASIVREHMIWLAKPSELNDPFDCKPAFKAPTPTELVGVNARMGIKRKWELHGVPRREARRIYRGRMSSGTLHSRLTQQVHDSHGVFCMSESWEISPMWTHYGGNGYGVCLEFDSSDPLMPFGQAQRVSYVAQRPAIKNVSCYPTEEQGNYIHASFLTKSVQWEHEREWRLLMPRQVGKLAFRGDLLTAIYIGDAVPQRDRDRIVNDLGCQAVRLYVVRPSDHAYGFDRTLLGK